MKKAERLEKSGRKALAQAKRLLERAATLEQRAMARSQKS